MIKDKVHTFVESVNESALKSQEHRDFDQQLFSIGRYALQLKIARTQQSHLFIRSLVPVLDASASIQNQHVLTAWDGMSSENQPPSRPWGINGHAPLGLVNEYSRDAYKCAYDIHTESLLVQDAQTNSSWVWYPDFDVLPAWAIASPFRIPLSWFANLNSMQMVHGAAVSVQGKAALLTAPGGSGKSTTSLMCALSGMDYLGDDYVVVEPGTNEIHMVYRTAKLFNPSIELIPALSDAIINKSELASQKGVLFLDNSSISMKSSSQLALIIIPHVNLSAPTSIAEVPAAQALNAILPSTIGGLMGGTSVTPRLLLQTVRNVPSFALNIGYDTKSIVELVAQTLGKYS